MLLVFQELAKQTSQIMKIIKFCLAFHNLNWYNNISTFGQQLFNLVIFPLIW